MYFMPLTFFHSCFQWQNVLGMPIIKIANLLKISSKKLFQFLLFHHLSYPASQSPFLTYASFGGKSENFPLFHKACIAREGALTHRVHLR